MTILITHIEKTNNRFYQDKYFWILAFVWTGIMAFSLIWNMQEERKETLESARIQARTAYQKDVLYRDWNTLHGGVYVPVTGKTPVNPYLTEVKERDIKTPSGRRLTLMNPAYMTRQAHELAAKETGIQGHITSLNPIRPENAADEWETECLKTFMHGQEECSQVRSLNRVLHMRMMRPLVTKKGCLKCHAHQGYEEGDIRGGISVSVPMAPLMAVLQERQSDFLTAHGLLWMVGLGLIMLWVRGFLRSEEMSRKNDLEIRRLEKRIMEAQKRESLIVMAGGIAHDFNNILTGVLGNTELMLMDLSDDSPYRASIEEIETASLRAIELSQKMLAYSGKGQAHLTETDLSDFIRELTPQLQRSISSKASLDFNLEDNLPRIQIDHNQTGQVIESLIMNASEALGDLGGKIEISTFSKHCDSSYLETTTLASHPMPEGTYVCLEVKDTGSGMTDSTLKKIFDPFFTTKFTGRGLGLAAVLGIMETNKGTISASSQVGRGSTFTVYFPELKSDPTE